jgi:CBS domain containing-hemolysin-like protein
MSEHRRERSRRRARSVEAAAIAGIAYSLLTLFALVQLNRYPSLSLPEDELTAWFDDGDHRALLIASLGASSVAAIAFLWFVAVIRRRVGHREDQFFATVFLGSGIVNVCISVVAMAAIAAPAMAMTMLDAAEVSSSSASLAGGMGAALLLVVAPRVQAVFIISTSTVILRSRMLPSWVAVAGYVLAGVMFIVPIVYRSLGLAFPIWVFVVSIVLLVIRPSDLQVDRPRDDATEPD